MNPFARILPHVWIVALSAALGVLAWADTRRADRVDAVSALTADVVADDPRSPTGHAGGRRTLLIPEHNNESMQWIAQTQTMLAHGEWRLRHVDYDNAPQGRDVRSPSAYRWWMASVAWLHHTITDTSIALSVERATLLADPLLHVLLALIFTWYTWRRFGAVAAAFLAVGFVTLFPFASAFIPGQPGDQGITLGCMLASVLPLAAAEFNATTLSAKGRRRAFALAGICGGIGLWINVRYQAPFVIGIAVGALLSSWLRRARSKAPTAQSAPSAPWRTWAVAGAATTVACYTIEFFPNHLDLPAWRLDEAHPLYAVAWLGLGELLARALSWIERRPTVWNRAAIIRVVLAALAVVALPTALVFSSGPGFLAPDDLAHRLTDLPGNFSAPNLGAWLRSDFFSGPVWATLLPLGAGGFAVWILGRAQVGPDARAAAAVAMGPLLVAIGFACVRLRWWNAVDVGLLPLAVVAAAAARHLAAKRNLGLAGAGVALACALPGVVVLFPPSARSGDIAVAESEVKNMLERDLAHWLAAHAGPDGAVVLAPPNLTVSLFYYGGLRGLGTPFAGNASGLAAAARIAAANSADEAQALVNQRQVTHIVMPSWDTFLDEYARLGSNQPDHALVALLHQWLPPRWLRPVAYDVPNVEGFAPQSVTIFQVVEVQDNATALSRLAEYFVDMGMLDPAGRLASAIEHSFPTDSGALVACCRVAIAVRNGPKLAELVKTLRPHLERGDARDLPWDRRVSLALVLVQTNQVDAARDEIQRCVEDLDADRLRFLSTRELYQLLLLAKSFGIVIDDPELQNLVRELLPPEMRSRL